MALPSPSRDAELPLALLFAADSPAQAPAACNAAAEGDALDDLLLLEDDAALLSELLGVGPPAASPCALPAPDAAARCLDASHPRGCTECHPAPRPDEAHLFKLVGDAGRKNGEKKVRALIAAQEQWKSGEQREALAERMLASGERELALALRRRDTSLLRKRHLLHLAHVWGLRSNLWRRKQQAAHAGVAAAAQQQQQQQQLALRPRAASPLREAALTRDLHLHAYATSDLTRLCAQAAALTSGAEARRAITATGAFVLVTPFALTEWQGVLLVNRQLKGAAASALAALAALRSRMEGASGANEAEEEALDGDAPAWQALQGGTTPAETLLEHVRAAYAVGTRLIQTRSAARWHDRQPAAVERVYFEEPLASAHASLEHVARGCATLAQLRLGRAREYLVAAEAVAQAVSDSLHVQDRAALDRLSWLSDFVARRDADAAVAAAVVPLNFPVLEAEAASVMPVNWDNLAAQVSTMKSQLLPE